MDVEHIFKIIKKHRNRAVRKYKESRSDNINDSYYNGMIKVLDELKNEIKEALK